MSRTAICTILLVLVSILFGSAAWAQENQIVNSEFDDGTTGWGRYGTAGFDVAIVQGAGLSGVNAIVMDVTDASATASIGIAQDGLLLEPDVTYPIGFTAKAGQAREMVVLLQTNLNNTSWPTQMLETIELTPNAQTYVFEYTHTGDALGDDETETVTLYLMLKGTWWPMGGDDLNTKVWIDRVYFGGEPPLPRRDLATAPDPADEASDVWRDADLGWTPGAFAQTHDVYLGTVFDDVNTATRANPMEVLASQGQSDAAYDPGRLAYDQTYYWRVDEVNSPPDNTVIKGSVWSFTTEPLAYPIAGVVATSNTLSTENESPANAVNGSGLSEDDTHSTVTSDMWLGSPGGEEPLYIQFEFDRVYKLHEMVVWNYNAEFEFMLGFGLKDVTVEYSVDGAAWTSLGQMEFARGTSLLEYVANTVVDFAGVAARYVRVTVLSNWGTHDQYGLSEVRFLYVPVQARNPEPADGALDVEHGAVLTWRAGREAASHQVYLDTDEAAVSEGSGQADTVNENVYQPSDLSFGQTYYWKVNEVNDAEATASWEGDLWHFTVQDYAVIDGFEAYNDDDNLIYETWVDGWVNGSGSLVGYLEPPYAEIGIVHGGGQSMPMEYNNSVSPFYSEASRTWEAAQNWAVGEADVLRLYFRGNAANTSETLYVMVEDQAGQATVVSHADAAAVTVESWQEWNIPLESLQGVDMTAVVEMTIGVGNREAPASGGTGILYLDDIEFGRSSSTPETTE